MVRALFLVLNLIGPVSCVPSVGEGSVLAIFPERL